MTDLSNKKIILGVTGGIAAYKSAELLRLLITQGAQVQVVMTEAAAEFVGSLTFQALSGRPVRNTLFDLNAEAGMGHIELARWADLMLIAPATANTIAKIAHGMADDLLTTLCLASKAPLLIAPAMNQQMWLNEVTQANCELLRRRNNVTLCEPAQGELACGDNGPGRMQEPGELVTCCRNEFERTKNKNECSDTASLRGRRVLITAGPTIEDIDPVRYMSNRSSGKMGYAIAQAAQQCGAEVTLVSGPVALPAPDKVKLIAVRSAQQMHDAVFQAIAATDIFIAAAAVADYRPISRKPHKIKKHKDSLTIELIKNPDILADVAAIKDKPLTIGFAAETNALEKHALDKLKRKKLDMIIANKVGEAEGFEVDNNELHLFWHDDDGGHEANYKKLPYADKKQLARQLMDEIVLRFVVAE